MMVRSKTAALAVVTLTACATSDPSLNEVRNGSQSQPVSGGATPPTSQSAPVLLDQGVAAFSDICLATAPDFTDAPAAAAVYGVTDFTEVGDLKLGLRTDNAISVQLTGTSECAVTTPSRAANPRNQFLSIVPGLTASTLPAATTIGGSSFIIQHDRQGGEAFVMLKR
jgi:hypothetical protein